uniref:histone-like nucleoid-structuring protein, MvaT/MvaU family n=1 Tax=Pseudomonas fluorescens TaxID=294 RepID=UPI0025B79E71|nr:histone-like nucleoid-structuring protein, MvaT/MvaU family [Pseudomonas fluorescens]
MSLITEYRATEEAIKELQDRLEKLSGNEALLKEMEFEKKLRALMSEYGKSLRDIIAILDPDYRKQITHQPGKPRAQRVVKVYRNPNTGELVETKGGNHKTLKEWKQEHGAAVVETWRTQ